METISELTQSLINELYEKITDSEVDEIIKSVSFKMQKAEIEEMDSSIKKIYDRLDFSKKTAEERKQFACEIYVHEMIKQAQREME